MGDLSDYTGNLYYSVDISGRSGNPFADAASYADEVAGFVDTQFKYLKGLSLIHI